MGGGGGESRVEVKGRVGVGVRDGAWLEAPGGGGSQSRKGHRLLSNPWRVVAVVTPDG